MIIPIMGQDFEEHVVNSDLPVLACFTERSCQTCFAFHLVAKELAQEYAGRLKFVSIDVADNPELAAQYRIRSVPSAILFRAATPVKKLLGFYYKGELRKHLSAALG